MRTSASGNGFGCSRYCPRYVRRQPLLSRESPAQMKSFLMYCSAATVALAAASVPVAAQQIAASAPAAKPVAVAELVKRVDIPYEEFTLKNGLRVIVHTDRKAPIVAVSTWYDVGSKHEPRGKTGFAHLF